MVANVDTQVVSTEYYAVKALIASLLLKIIFSMLEKNSKRSTRTLPT
jgi:hypothetical protein